MLIRLLLLIGFTSINLSCVSKTHLPILSHYIDSNGKKVNYNIENFEFTNQLNQKVTGKNTKGKVYIANFFFTRCPSICPKMKVGLTRVAHVYKNADDFMILSFSIDPKNDSIPILKSYANSTGVLNSKWHFLNGKQSQLDHVATLFRTSFKPLNNGIDFYHSSFTALVDKNQQIRGFYDLLDEQSITELIKGIDFLLDN
ncbi:SCO family protein [Snuella sedimenti]|uniref:SCO family protein n=1 Tax=Snuella sedimenti TaxID=2798802 RepID=A0A8J7IWF5_9FLAO|nr:SCO family protein [Snuella sedimenti]MBJ6368335.1 SCO family protein [Snuella sedimenti]